MIKFESVHLKQKEKTIFTALDFAVQKNDKILIQGKSGTGKTTLFRTILGFESIDKGSVIFNGRAVTRNHIRNIRKEIFYLSQDIDLKNEKVGTLIDEVCDHNSVNGRGNTRFAQWLAFLDLDETILDQWVEQLSGGERQRIGLLLGFLLDRPVWLLDEPTSALDNGMKKKIADYILDLPKTIVIISHDDVWNHDERLKIKGVI